MRRLTARGAATVLAVVMPVTGCSVLSAPNTSARPHPATPSAPPATDYSNLLITPSALGAPFEKYTAAPPKSDPNGVPGASTELLNAADTRAIGNTIYVLPTAAAATSALNGARQALGTVVRGAVAQPAPVGAGGTTASGASPDGSKAVTVVMFTEGRTFVTLNFDAAPADAVALQDATKAAQRQDALIKKTPI